MSRIENIVNKIHCADCLEFMKHMPDECVDCIVTSPPYWGLRAYSTNPQVWGGDDKCEHEWVEVDEVHNLSYRAGRSTTVGNNKSPKIWKLPKVKKINLQAGNPEFQRPWRAQASKEVSNGCFCITCHAWRGELGLETSIELYISHLVQIFDDCQRVLKKTGTCWVNIGDTYSGSGGAGGDYNEGGLKEGQPKFKQGNSNLPPKSLCQIPERFSIAMSDAGWIKRNTIIWHKRNCMPSSAKDRFTVDFEYLYFFVKNQKYWFEQQLEDSYWATYDKRADVAGGVPHKSGKSTEGKYGFNGTGYTEGRKRNMRCVWDVPTEPNPEAHFATYPRSLITTCIKAGCPPNGIVLDPFMGSGTTALEAKEQGKNFIGIELNPEYCKIAEKRLKQEVLPFIRRENTQAQTGAQ